MGMCQKEIQGLYGQEGNPQARSFLCNPAVKVFTSEWEGLDFGPTS